MSYVSTRCGQSLRFVLALALVIGPAWQAMAGHQLFRQNSVGGVKIDPEGVLGPRTAKDASLHRAEVLREMKAVPDELGGKTELRKISLKRLEAVIADALKNKLGVLPDEVKYLAGLQRIEYVLVFPEDNDIVLAGPGEGWKVGESGEVVGVTTGRPVIQLDDLLVAFRTADSARRVGISCSIDPSEDGLNRLNALLRSLKVFDASVPARVEQTLGPQKITLTGVPTDSHFARVMTAADYRMKRYAMKLEPAPVRGLVSFVDLTRGPTGNMMPRWWLSCDYDAVARSEDGLAWNLRGAGVKTETENPDGAKDPIAQRWADLMTENYADLSTRDTVFGELRNLMDMCVIAALIQKEGLLEKASCSLPLITDPDSLLMTDSWNPPKSVATQASATKKGRNWVITASGGVLVDSWQVATDLQQQDAAVGEVRAAARRPADREPWWWN
ncbi:MAG: DUF1598 domain-containing protein [Planctomycetales bacterium]|nr:DUF1598 domain-containing protein [Planctomycetales bacterium]